MIPFMAPSAMKERRSIQAPEMLSIPCGVENLIAPHCVALIQNWERLLKGILDTASLCRTQQTPAQRHTTEEIVM